MDRLYIVLPAYNEEENIRSVIADWYPVAEMAGPDSRLVIVDDGSRDATYTIMQEEARRRPQFIALTKPNSGHGPTVLYAYRYALREGADYVFQTDSDGQTLPSEFAPFWEKRRSYAMIIGNRTQRQDGPARVFVTRTLRLVIRLCFGVSLPDANTPFRLMEAGSLEENLRYIPDDFFLSNVVLAVIYARRKLPVLYLPITFRPRQGGVNSINLRRIVGIGARALRDFRAINRALDRDLGDA